MFGDLIPHARSFAVVVSCPEWPHGACLLNAMIYSWVILDCASWSLSHVVWVNWLSSNESRIALGLWVINCCVILATRCVIPWVVIIAAIMGLSGLGIWVNRLESLQQICNWLSFSFFTGLSGYHFSLHAFLCVAPWEGSFVLSILTRDIMVVSSWHLSIKSLRGCLSPGALWWLAPPDPCG